MNQVTLKLAAMAALLLPAPLCTLSANAQQRYAKPSADPQKPHEVYFTPHRAETVTPEFRAVTHRQAAGGQTIPLWSYTTVAKQDGKTYTGSMVGRSPFAHGHRITTVPTYIIPIIMQFQDSGDTFDPTTYDGCAPNNESVIDLILQSPLIGTPSMTMNGVNVGTGQYLDLFQRANFWAAVGGTPYHTTFSTTPTVLSAITVSVPPDHGVTQSYLDFGGCQDVGKVDQGWWDNMLQTVIIPQLASEGVGPANFPQFVLDSVAEYLGGDTSKCCALGYHNAFLNGGTFQSYSSNEWDTSGAFSGTTSTMSHEIAEWMDDPAVNNATPAWGGEGQVVSPACQANLEVGDPLSPNYPTPTNPFYLTFKSTGVQYELQELTFYSWFFGNTPSLGAGGGYSDNGTFKGYAKPCPNGGTN